MFNSFVESADEVVEALKIVGMCILAAIVFGILHDMVTAHLCVEYFSEWHDNPLDLHDPVSLAFFWGFVATWAMGVVLGMLIAASALIGKRPKLRWRQLIRPVSLLLCVMGFLSAATGVLVYSTNASAAQFLGMDAPFEGGLRHRFEAVLAAHNMSYFAGFWGALILCALIWRKRARS